MVTACFVRHQRPSFAEAIDQCVAQGAQEIVIVPYALALSEHDRGELERLADSARQMHPHLALQITGPLGYHAALAQVLVQRIIEADYVAAHHIWGHQQRAAWPSWPQQHAIGLVVVIDNPAGIPATLKEELLALHHHVPRYTDIHFCAIDQNELDLKAPLAALTAQGCQWVIIAPYVLEQCTFVVAAIERAIAEIRARYPGITVIQAEHLAYDRRLLKAIVDCLQTPG
jgi:sirohydrochlorin cobaltochelatase